MKKEQILSFLNHPYLNIVGLITAISYMIVILFTWIYANHQGYVYFSAGEPILIIKYIEWTLATISIYTLTSKLVCEINLIISQNNTIKKI